jgi:hypothetical protein
MKPSTTNFTNSFRESSLRALRRLDHLRTPDKFHRMHLPYGGSAWEFGDPIVAATIHHAGQFYAVTVSEHTLTANPATKRVTIFLRHLRRLGEPSSNTPHLTVHSNCVENGIVTVHPKLTRTEQPKVDGRIRRLGLVANGNSIAVTRYNHPDLFPKLLALCSIIAAVKSHRRKTKLI